MLCRYDDEAVEMTGVLYKGQSHSLTGNCSPLSENAIDILLLTNYLCLRKVSSHQKLLNCVCPLLCGERGPGVRLW